MGRIASRREFLKEVATGAIVLTAGCTGINTEGGQSDTTAPTTTATTGRQEPATASDVVPSEPTCSETAADQLLTVTPQGVVFITQSQTDAERLRETILTDETKAAERDDIRLVPVPNRNRVAVELDDTEFNAYAEFETEPGVETARKGRSLPTVVDVANRYRSQFQSSNAVTPTEISMTYVQPEAPAPTRCTLAVTGVGNTSVLERLTSFETRVVGPDGEQTVLTGSDITDAVPRTRNGQTRLVLWVAEPAQARFVEALREAGVLSSPHGDPLRVYSNGEKLTALGLSTGLVKSMRRGTWSGGLVLNLASEQTRREVATALGVVTLDIHTTTTLQTCS